MAGNTDGTVIVLISYIFKEKIIIKNMLCNFHHARVVSIVSCISFLFLLLSCSLPPFCSPNVTREPPSLNPLNKCL